MTADGFLQQKQRHPLAMTAAVAINLAAVTALMLAKSGAIAVDPGVIHLIPINEPVPPPPHDIPKPHPKSGTPTAPPQPKPILGGESIDKPIFATTDNVSGNIDGPIAPTFPELPIGPQKQVEPVTVGAQPDQRYAGDFQPPYPPQLLRTGVEGKVVVKILIGADGRVKQVAILSADDPLFADAAERQALRKWRFKPATRDGAPIESWKQMTVRFEIRP
ncbi:MAG TPA: TonB family protein [Sphingomonas sp.]|nr:TonB family protein [Sphingomonas sp.]